MKAFSETSTALRCVSFSEKKHRKEHLIIDTIIIARRDDNCYYFCKSNIPVINLIAVSRNMVKLSKNMSL